jgi:anti-sigma factor ChrR (cupin superfamily)
VNNRRLVSTADPHELASLYALGALDADEKIVFEEHLRQGCDGCTMAVRSFADTVSLLGESIPAVPPPSLRTRLLSRVSRSTRVPGILLQQNGLLIARSDELAWQTMAPGISYKPLYGDATQKNNTALVRMEAGAHYPSHHHAAIEELFMLSGDLHGENHVMGAGDYCRADSGSIHGETFTEAGCLFLMMASPENQLIENRVI